MKTHARSLIELLKGHFGTVRRLVGAEVGVWRGELSECLLNNVPHLTLHMVDPWEKLEVATPTMPKHLDEVIAAREEAEARTQYKRRIVHQMTSAQAARDMYMLSRKIDFAFIDANHMYEQVREDIDAWWPLIRQNGILAGHDYNGRGDRVLGWGVKRAVDERFGSMVRLLPGRVWWVLK